jgi:hypothetical protein
LVFEKYDRIDKTWFDDWNKSFKPIINNIERLNIINVKSEALKTIRNTFIDTIRKMKNYKAETEKLKTQIEIKRKEIYKSIDNSICPIIKDKYCNKCIKILKNETT